MNRFNLIAAIVLIALTLVIATRGTQPLAAPAAPAAPATGERFEVKQVGVREDKDNMVHFMYVYILSDRQTGQQWVAMPGVGLTPMAK